MSPDPSLRDHLSDSVEDDDDEMNEYEIFDRPQPLPRFQQQAPQQACQQAQQISLQQLQQSNMQYQLWQQQQQQQQLQQQYMYGLQRPEDTPTTPLQLLRPHHPMVLQRTNSLPQFPTLETLYRQFQQEQSRSSLQQQPFVSASTESDQQPLTSLPQYPTNSPLYNVPGAERFVPLPEQITDLATLDHYLSTLQQPSTLQNTISVLDQDMDLMMLSSLNLSGQGNLDLQELPTSSSVQSPSLSWTSTSPTRETSRSSSPVHLRQVSFSQLASNFTSPVVEAQNEISLASPETIPTSPTASEYASASSPSPKRRRRVRPPTVKKPKKVKPTSFTCESPGCGKVFSRAYNLTSHMKTHSSERPFLCGVCPLAFARRHDRERHIRLHTGEKPYNCEICGAGFMRNDALNRHQKLCGVAGSSFATDIYDDLGREDDFGGESGSASQWQGEGQGQGEPSSGNASAI
ncbi:hypothetical protein BGX26_011812 [Mortierella sp. AD094]|nr:hypothetical protein BGX26_011812 [Mortierella sp. AD094]